MMTVKLTGREVRAVRTLLFMVLTNGDQWEDSADLTQLNAVYEKLTDGHTVETD